ncbi:MAG: putative Fe-S cluster assembly protein SufT [Opitutales bacterium]
MSVDNQRTLTRDVEASVIPEGRMMVLPKEGEVTVTHRLGGNFTVLFQHGLFRIAGKDADALGEAIPEEAAQAPASASAASGPPEKEQLWDALKQVFDPEIPVNIVDLGLVYSLEVQPREGTEQQYTVNVDMTLTAPGCGMGPVIADDARQRVLTVPGVSDAEINLVWDPPWNQEMISEEGKMQLGLI